MTPLSPPDAPLETSPGAIDPTPLIELATAYWGSATLIAAVRLDVFSHLAAGASTPEQVAERAGADPVAVEALLIGLAGLGLLVKQGDAYQNGALAEAFLVAGRPRHLGPALLYNGDVFPLWAELDEVIRRGAAQRAPAHYLGGDAERTRNFVFGMHHRALGVGRAVCGAIDLEGRERLADIGGGPGTYAALLAQRFPTLNAEVLDLPPVVAIARDIVASMGVSSERVRCTAYDYCVDPLPGRYDAALISGVLHREQPPRVQSILGQVAEAMEAGGVLYISDVMLDDTRDGPLFATMFALNMRVLAHDGRCHSVAEQRAWLAQAGFDVQHVVRLPPPINYTVIRAIRR